MDRRNRRNSRNDSVAVCTTEKEQVKPKIIAIIAVIAVISALFCISAFAQGERTFEEETIIHVNVTQYTATYHGTVQYGNKIQYLSSSPSGYYGVTYITRAEGQNTLLQVRFNYYGGTTATLSSGSTLKIPANTTLSEEQVNLLYEVTDLTPPPPPPPQPMETVLENVDGVWNTTLTVSTLIITWLVANQIALCGLYLYILIAVIGICKRFVNAK